MQDNYQEQVQAVRFQYLDRRKKRKADLFMAQWLHLKIAVAQSKSMRVLRKQESELNDFFNQPVLKTLLSQNPERAEMAIFDEIKDSALLYQKACMEDSHYTTRLFGLMKLKDNQIAEKAGVEAYQSIIQPLLSMSNTFWRNQMIVALHSAYQDIFMENAVSASEFFHDMKQYQDFKKIIQDFSLAGGTTDIESERK